MPLYNLKDQAYTASASDLLCTHALCLDDHGAGARQTDSTEHPARLCKAMQQSFGTRTVTVNPLSAGRGCKIAQGPCFRRCLKASPTANYMLQTGPVRFKA